MRVGDYGAKREDQSMSKKHSSLPYGRAICYSGYRNGQSPVTGAYPSYEQIKEDLLILEPNWDYLRLYDSSTHAELVLKVIQDEKLSLRVLLGNDLAAELSNPNCPWEAQYSVTQLAENKAYNIRGLLRTIELSNRFSDIVVAVSIGNEASVDWTDHLVSVESLIAYALILREKIPQPITFCENYVPWWNKLAPLVEVIDFISIHTYPVWEYQGLESAMDYTVSNYTSVASKYPDKPVIITEAGWATKSNGRGIEVNNASEELQCEYLRQLVNWAESEQVLTFVFEAFDEPWKGSEHSDEPEKHWGIYYESRAEKPAVKTMRLVKG